MMGDSPHNNTHAGEVESQPRVRHEMKVLLDGPDEEYVPSEEPSITDEPPTGPCTRLCAFMWKYLFVILNLLGVIVGFGLAFILRRFDISDDAIMWLGLPGDVFLRILKLTIVPLIVSNVIAGAAEVDPASNGRAGILALLYNIFFNFIGAGIGVLLAYTIKPGVGVSTEGTVQQIMTSKVRTQDIFADLIRNLVPDNVVRATMQKEQTTFISSPSLQDQLKNATLNVTSGVRTVTYVHDVNILGLLFFCGVFGVAASLHREKTRPIKDFFRACADVMLIVLGWFVWVSPIGVCSLILVAVVQVPQLETVLIKVIVFFAIVTGGVLFQELFLFPSIYFLAVRKNPYPILPASARAWAIAFASSSSSCTMPELFRVTESRGCDLRLTSLTVPICVTLNATGSGLFIAVAVIFLAQASDLVLSGGEYLIIGSLTALSAMVLPSVPSASLVTVVMILSTLGIPTQHIGLLFTVEWFLDRIRTTCNVVGEIYGVFLIDHFCKKKIKTEDINISEEYSGNV